MECAEWLFQHIQALYRHKTDGFFTTKKDVPSVLTTPVTQAI